MRLFRSVAVALTLVFMTCLVLPGQILAAPMTLRYACHHGPTDIHSKLIEAWIAEVEKRTDGKLKIDFYPGQSLVKAPQTYDAVLNGMTDIGFSILQYTRGRFPLFDFINLPLGYFSAPVSTAIINEVLDKFQPEELQDVKVLYLHANPTHSIHTVGTPIHQMSDLKGMKIRAVGPTATMIKALGGTPMALPMPELYQALQKGVIQGAVYDFTAAVDWKLAEISKYTAYSAPTGVSLGFFVVMNKDKWNALDPETQKIIDELSLEWAGRHGQAWEESEVRGIKFALTQGASIIGIDSKEAASWKEAVKPVIDEYLDNTKAKGVPGKEVLEYVEKRLDEAKAGKFESKYLLK